MFTPTQVTTRDLLRNYKRVINRVKTTKDPAVVVSQKEPQVAIVSLADLEALRDLRYRDSGRVLRETAHRVRAVLKDEHLPVDLSVHHDDYLWGEEGSSNPQDA
jgi:prevent-host-death family protein